jgi:hypothetical protein
VLIVNRGLLLLDSTAYQDFVIRSPVMHSPAGLSYWVEFAGGGRLDCERGEPQYAQQCRPPFLSILLGCRSTR